MEFKSHDDEPGYDVEITATEERKVLKNLAIEVGKLVEDRVSLRWRCKGPNSDRERAVIEVLSESGKQKSVEVATPDSKDGKYILYPFDGLEELTPTAVNTQKTMVKGIINYFDG